MTTRPTYAIWIKTKEGDEILAFHWVRHPEAGVLRAIAEGPQFGFSVAQAWAVEV